MGSHVGRPAAAQTTLPRVARGAPQREANEDLSMAAIALYADEGHEILDQDLGKSGAPQKAVCTMVELNLPAQAQNRGFGAGGCDHAHDSKLIYIQFWLIKGR